MQETNADRWFGVRCVFRHGEGTYEERIVMVLAPSAEAAIEKAEEDAAEYAAMLGAPYLGLAQSYEIADDPGDGAEVFSDLADEDYLDTFFDTGGERQQDVETPPFPKSRPDGPPTDEPSAGEPSPDAGSVRSAAIATWTINHFSQSNPAGTGQGDVAALLRRVAQSIDDLGDVSVQDLTFASSVTAGEDDLTLTVYYHPEPRRR